MTLRNIFPVTLGANVCTTITALLAALASGSVDALTIALVHTTCNVIGIVEPNPSAIVDILDALTVAQAAAGVPGIVLACC